MQVDDDSQTTLSKWPFILGDLLLVATALAIAILGDWQLTNWQVASCVIAVTLGAGLFVLPYIVEYWVRVKEDQDDRDAEIRILEKHILSARQTLEDMDVRMRTLEATDVPNQTVDSALADLIDQRLTHIEQAKDEQKAAIAALRDKLAKLPQEATPAFDPTVLKPIEERIAALEENPTSQAPAPPPSEPESVPKSEEAKPATRKIPVKPPKNVSQIERPKRSDRKRRGPEESSLLKRAITETQGSSSTAVSRIIKSKPSESETPKPIESRPLEHASELEETKISIEELKPEKNSASQKVETKTEPSQEIEKPQYDALDLTAEVPALDSSDMLFDDEAVSKPIKKARAKKNDAVITASIFIGIGNKPYLRGSGAGLTWQSGLTMEFVEIGKWRWIAPSDLAEPIEVQLYRNDEDADKSGKYTLKPGQKLEISPVF